ncbi:MAG: hypothetical protein PHU85_07565 [Phycisphaerae bacterium]|nr:hypothetical protein [Phycisphaerae bacterium]
MHRPLQARDFSPQELTRLARTPPRTPDELHFLCRTLFGLHLPRSSVCPNHCGPFDYVRDAYFDAFSDAVIWANRGGGKTTLGALVSVLDALYKPGIKIRILGGSLEQSRKMYDAAAGMVLRGGALANCLASGVDPHLGRRRGITARTLRFANGSEIEILAQSERSVRGNRVQKMRCDEVELFDTDVWSSCQLVTESKPIQGAGVGGWGLAENSPTPNPQSPTPHPPPPTPDPQPLTPALARGAVEAFSTFHRIGGLMADIVEQANERRSPVYRWCVLDVLERCPKERSCAACPLAPECAGRARQADGFFRIDDAIAAKQRVSKELWESEMLCLRPTRRGAVFPTFSRERHTAELRPRRGWPIYRAIDFGFANPFVCLWLQVSPAGDVFVLKEYLRSAATIHVHAGAIKALDPAHVAMTYCDPAGSQRDQITGTTARSELRSYRIETRARPSAIVEGLELIRRHLDGGQTSAGGNGGPMLRIDSRCERLILAMEAYRYPDPGERSGGNSELPIKDGVHDHPIDALRYFFVNHRQESKLVERLY